MSFYWNGGGGGWYCLLLVPVQLCYDHLQSPYSTDDDPKNGPYSVAWKP